MSRQATIAGRTGTVLISVGLALLLVSLIPARQQEYPASSDQDLTASNFQYLSFFSNLNPQRGFHANITTDREMRVYVFGNSDVYIYDWIRTHLTDPNNYTDQWKTFMLDAFLDNHTNLIGYQTNVTGQAEFDYTPTRVEETTTLIFANYGNETIRYQYKISIISALAPTAKLQRTAAIMMPIGLILAAPWIIDKTKEKRQPTTKKNS